MGKAKTMTAWTNALSALLIIAFAGDALAQGPAARDLFGSKSLPSQAAPAAFGFYNKGCLAGGVAIPTDGPTWQAMRLSRNRRWGHPDMIALLDRLSREAAAQDGWPGLLIGDISQPRGGPMLSGHASHQIGLDADIWLTPMPDRRLSYREREDISARTVLREGTLQVDPSVWTPAHARVIMRAASYREVQRIFVHPGIKQKLCDSWQGDRSHLGKVRPYWGHHYHFHIRMRCPDGSPGCTPQAPIGRGTGCDESLAWWFTDEPWAQPDDPPPAPTKPRLTQLSELPNACAIVLDSDAVSEEAATYPASSAANAYQAVDVPVPTPRPR
ncbi:penicillin-insensitive murein endopeptidase [Pararhizobium haloflavum]|uniref:penicillin-insensitive murein endopeptidase n=1 Tax=Pararhizobium haloflavum TaxID=2037914 RepID=UPI000C173D03|nr:penicillin-insensitive murein endopeptidase [Pararhizobium haloflavum]